MMVLLGFQHETGPIGRCMSEQGEEKALQEGHECAMTALAGQRRKVASLEPGDRLHWWLGFLAAAMGAALASVGEPALRVLHSALGDDEDSAAAAPRRRDVVSAMRQRTKRTYIRGTATRIKKKA